MNKDQSPMRSQLRPLPPTEKKGSGAPSAMSSAMERGQEQNEEDVVMEDANPPQRRQEPVLNSSFTKKQLIKAHRRHIDEFMLLIKEDMQLLKCFDKDEFSDTEYQLKLKHVLDQQEKAVQRYKRKVFNQ